MLLADFSFRSIFFIDQSFLDVIIHIIKIIILYLKTVLSLDQLKICFYFDIESQMLDIHNNSQFLLMLLFTSALFKPAKWGLSIIWSIYNKENTCFVGADAMIFSLNLMLVLEISNNSRTGQHAMWDVGNKKCSPVKKLIKYHDSNQYNKFF